MQIEEAISDFLRFLRNPRYAWKQDDPIPFTTMTLLYVIIFFLILIVSSPLMYLVGVDNMEHAIDDLIENYPKWVFVILTVGLAPLVEEIIFRWHLRQPMVIIIVLFLLLSGGLYSIHYASMLALWPTVIIGVFLLALTVLLATSGSFREGLRGFYDKRFPWVFYTTVLFFAMAHISNFSSLDRWYIAPVLVLPQAIIGLFLGYVRVRNNLLWSIYFHAFHNLIPTLLFLFIPTDI